MASQQCAYLLFTIGDSMNQSNRSARIIDALFHVENIGRNIWRIGFQLTILFFGVLYVLKMCF